MSINVPADTLNDLSSASLRVTFDGGARITNGSLPSNLPIYPVIPTEGPTHHGGRLCGVNPLSDGQNHICKEEGCTTRANGSKNRFITSLDTNCSPWDVRTP